VPCWPSVPEAAYFSVCSLSGVFEGGGAGVSGDESAFIEALDMEVKAAAHDALVQGWLWANRPIYGSDSAERREAAEAWAADVEASGKTLEVLKALFAE
jgi:hypothetical protein